MDSKAAKLGANMALKELGIEKATTKAYEYDGTPVDGKTHVKISNDTPDLNTYSKVLAFEEDAWMEIPQEYLSVVSEENGTALMMGDEKWFLVSTTGEGMPEGAGLYAIAAEVPIRLEFSSAAKPIDPKYLPIGKSIDSDNYGNGLQSINAVIVMLAVGDTGGGTFTYENGMEQFWADVLAKQPDYLIFRIYGNEIRVTVSGLYVTEAALQEGSAAISAVGLLTLYGMSVMGNFVLTQEGEAGLKIAVKADPVEFPDYVLEV